MEISKKEIKMPLSLNSPLLLTKLMIKKWLKFPRKLRKKLRKLKMPLKKETKMRLLKPWKKSLKLPKMKLKKP